MKNQIIGIICAMDIEIEYFKNIISNPLVEKKLYQEFIVGDYLGNKVVITKCGIGKVNAGCITLLMIEHYNPDLLINSGIAGGYKTNLKQLDLVIADKLIYSDVDMTTDSFSDLKYGQLQDLPPYFEVDNELLNKIKTFINDNTYFGTIITGDQFVTNYETTNELVELNFKDYNVLACDMESCAIAHVAYLSKTLFLIIRSISDIIGSNNPFEYQTFAPKAAHNAALLVSNIIKLL